MTHAAHRLLGSALAMLFGLAAGGCGATSLHNCTLIGAESGVVVRYDEVRQAHPKQSLQIEVCVDDDCQTQRVVGDSLIAGRDIVRDSSPVEVSVTISDKAGRAVFDAKTTVTPEKLQPNGPECDPTVWLGDVETTADGQLREVNPSRQ